MSPADDRVPVLYLAPWVDIGGSDKGTIDWFRFLDRARFSPSLLTTQPSPNRRLGEVIPYAEEVWDLPDIMHGNEFVRFILTFIHTRQIRILHLMNSRLGFELLPDIAALPASPRVVVQLHAEEPNRSGYVRYVTTRYGNLVDAFSLSSQDLSNRLGGYEVPSLKRRVIPTGIDARREFSPQRIRASARFDPGFLHILFPVRLTDQKDPLLMVEVASRLRTRGVRFRLHVVGDGDLAAAVRERVSMAGLEREVSLHGPSLDIAPWYAACDVVLLTSRFEGVPYAIYEAMAMATPVVAPALPGVSELLTSETGLLVTPREDPAGYVAALGSLAEDPARRGTMGSAARNRVLSEFSLERMAAEHGALYEELLGTEANAAPAAEARSQRRQGSRGRPRAGLRHRRPRATPLVSVVVPCFNHGRYLPACLKSIGDQTYAPTETIVVDDCSTDPETLETLDTIERTGGVTLLRMGVNRGPSAARNAAIEQSTGRYVLPLDADDLLLPWAVTVLVEQLGKAGEEIGFIYPNHKFFGNRTDYLEQPSYNLHALLSVNCCGTASLIDREIFDRGLRYPEDLVLGHEDWDFVLTLAEHGIYGEPARTKTFLYRKNGFTRAEFVEAVSGSFVEILAARHPNLYEAKAQVEVKGNWRPAVSVVALDACAGGCDERLPNIVEHALRQTCQDFEIVLRTPRAVWPTELGGRLRRVPSALAHSRAQAVAQGVEVARGRYILASYGSPETLLADPTLIEKTLRVHQINPHIEALAFAEAERPLTTFRLLQTDDVQSSQLRALCWEALARGAPPASLELHGDRPLETLARWLSFHEMVQWRHLPRGEHSGIASPGGGPTAAVGAPRHRRAADARIRARGQPQLPDLPAGAADRVRWPQVWTPPLSRMLCRHLHVASDRFVFTNDPAPPFGCVHHYDLGCVRGQPVPGTASLAAPRQGGESGFAVGEDRAIDASELLGFVEQVPLPLFDPLLIGLHRVTGQHVLIAGKEDPLRPMVEQVWAIGWIEPCPIHPRRAPHSEVRYGLVGLVRSVDFQRRSHRYGVGELPEGRLEGELGALFAEPTDECRPLWIDQHGRVLTPGWASGNGRPSVRAAARWAGAPLSWRGFSSAGPKLRATARRTYESLRILASQPARTLPPSTKPAGYLLSSASERTTALYASTHRVTGDQLLSTVEAELSLLGYGHSTLLGHLVLSAPMTGTLELARLPVPWASRFGLVGGAS